MFAPLFGVIVQLFAEFMLIVKLSNCIEQEVATANARNDAIKATGI